MATTTGVDGLMLLAVPTAFDRNGNGDAGCRRRPTGGDRWGGHFDTASADQPLDCAPAGATVISPLTTLDGQR